MLPPKKHPKVLVLKQSKLQNLLNPSKRSSFWGTSSFDPIPAPWVQLFSPFFNSWSSAIPAPSSLRTGTKFNTVIYFLGNPWAIIYGQISWGSSWFPSPPKKKGNMREWIWVGIWELNPTSDSSFSPWNSAIGLKHGKSTIVRARNNLSRQLPSGFFPLPFSCCSNAAPAPWIGFSCGSIWTGLMIQWLGLRGFKWKSC